MALTGQELYKSAAIDPEMFSEAIVGFEDLTPEAWETAVISYLDSDVVPGAIAEVAVAFRAATGAGSIDDFISCRFPSLGTEEASTLKAEGTALFDSAAKSFGRSEISRFIASDRTVHNEDSDLDREQGNDKLKKLISWAQMVMEQLGANPLDCDDNSDPDDPTSRYSGRMLSRFIPAYPVW